MTSSSDEWELKPAFLVERVGGQGNLDPNKALASSTKSQKLYVNVAWEDDESLEKVDVSMIRSRQDESKKVQLTVVTKDHVQGTIRDHFKRLVLIKYIG